MRYSALSYNDEVKTDMGKTDLADVVFKKSKYWKHMLLLSKVSNWFLKRVNTENVCYFYQRSLADCHKELQLWSFTGKMYTLKKVHRLASCFDL